MKLCTIVRYPGFRANLGRFGRSASPLSSSVEQSSRQAVEVPYVATCTKRWSTFMPTYRPVCNELPDCPLFAKWQ